MADKRVYVFQHVECEDLGTFAEVLDRRGMHAEYVRLFSGAEIPKDVVRAAALIFLGGPMSVNDESRYSYLAAEKVVIRQALARRTPTLGVCLGAQLLAAAAGSRVFRGARPEIGWAPVSLTTDGCQDAVLANIADLAAVFHWHAETFDLPPGAARLAFSGLTMNQAFRLGSEAYGLQFHLEVTPEMVDAWVRAYPEDLGRDAVETVARIAEDTAGSAPRLRAAAVIACDRFLDVVETHGCGDAAQRESG